MEIIMNADPRVVNCPTYILEFQCAKRWSQLIPTENPKQAYCEDCKEMVQLCVTLQDFEVQSDQGHCVAIPLNAACLESDELAVPGKTYWVGRPSKETVEKTRQAEHLILQAWWHENVLADEFLP